MLSKHNLITETTKLQNLLNANSSNVNKVLDKLMSFSRRHHILQLTVGAFTDKHMAGLLIYQARPDAKVCRKIDYNLDLLASLYCQYLNIKNNQGGVPNYEDNGMKKVVR